MRIWRAVRKGTVVELRCGKAFIRGAGVTESHNAVYVRDVSGDTIARLPKASDVVLGGDIAKDAGSEDEA